jgi:hypothetical protein
MMKRMRLVWLLLFIALTFPKQVFANELDLSLSPSIVEIIVAPGNSAQADFTLGNGTDNTLDVQSQFLAFQTGNDSEMKSWIRLLENGKPVSDSLTLRPR